jgi:hypothetical protein
MDRGSSTLNSEFKDFETFAFMFYRLRSCLLVFDVSFLLPSSRFWYCLLFNDLLFTTLPQPPQYGVFALMSSLPSRARHCLFAPAFAFKILQGKATHAYELSLRQTSTIRKRSYKFLLLKKNGVFVILVLLTETYQVSMEGDQSSFLSLRSHFWAAFIGLPGCISSFILGRNSLLG